MDRTSVPPVTQPQPQSRHVDTPVTNEANSSGVSWPAVIAGAFVTAALSLILLSLGTGLGLSSVSPWSNEGASASAAGKGAIVWLIVMQIIASAMGGYLSGRLRTKWTNTHTDEVYFRDTAHGFLAWAVALVLTASFLATAATSVLAAKAHPGPAAASRAETRSSDLSDYFIDTLFRSEKATADRNDSSARGEAGRILANALSQGDMPRDDKTYLTQLVANKTGLSQTDADKRLDDVLNQERQAADTTRRALAHLSLWMFVALLMGAFCASYAATIGGRQRDQVVVR
ncbi:MAG: hypothetical protein M3O09_00155 [Acidobacteriota bacterium]|nr:hypothetical protein [Acidobacteriota bacterium]